MQSRDREFIKKHKNQVTNKKKLEFKELRKRHYNEFEVVKRLRQERQDLGEDADDEDED